MVERGRCVFNSQFEYAFQRHGLEDIIQSERVLLVVVPSFVELWNAVRTEVLICEILHAFRCVDDHTGTLRSRMVASYLAAAASIVVEELA